MSGTPGATVSVAVERVTKHYNQGAVSVPVFANFSLTVPQMTGTTLIDGAYDVFLKSNNGTPGACGSAHGISLQGGTTCKGGSACPAGSFPRAAAAPIPWRSAPAAQVRWNAYRYCNSDVSCSDGVECVKAGACIESSGALLPLKGRLTPHWIRAWKQQRSWGMSAPCTPDSSDCRD